MPSALAERIGRRVGEPHAQLNADLFLNDLEPLDLIRRANDALGQREADREILEILRRRHHHRVSAAVIGERDGGLLGNHALARCRAVRAPAAAGDRGEGGRHGYSAASTTVVMRRLSREKSSYSCCQRVGPFEGETCTAVTLYSGQFVAQS